MTKASNPRPDLAERAGYLIEAAARAPSVHNTQPWRFTVTGETIELYADASRQLMEDLAGREMIISCGAALFGLRLAIRSLGCQPEVDLFPEPGQRRLLARVRAGRPAPMTSDERAMLQAAPHRHTHRDAFEPGPVPDGLVERLRDDAEAEGATLQRILLRAASQWVFARLQSQPLQSASVRAQIHASLTPSGPPQLLLELGVARTSCPTARRPADELRSS